MTDPFSKSFIVVGAGVVGISSALALQRAGYSVQVLERAEQLDTASERNAGAFAFADIVPLATPGIIRAAPKWLLDPLGPLSIPPGYFLSIAPWLIKFWRASWTDRFPVLMKAQAELMALSREALERLSNDVDGESLLQRDGQLRLYEGAASFQRSQAYRDACEEHGIDYRSLYSVSEIAEIQPGIAPRFDHAIYTPGWVNTKDPKLWLAHLRNVFLERGGSIEKTAVSSIERRSDAVSVQTDKGSFEASQMLVAAGAWSSHLARTLGDQIPLETERGYNTTVKSAPLGLNTHLTFADHGFVVTRIQQGLRVGGAVELGGLKKPPNYARAKILFKKAQDFLPELNGSTGEEWMGFRPSMPDSLPVISRSPRSDRVLYAFGHGHLGLTQAAGTAELICALATRTSVETDLAPFSANRF